MEVFLVSGDTISSIHQRQGATALPWRLLQLAVAPRDRVVLHRRIALRFEAMLQAGFLDEVAALRAAQDAIGRPLPGKMKNIDAMGGPFEPIPDDADPATMGFSPGGNLK